MILYPVVCFFGEEYISNEQITQYHFKSDDNIDEILNKYNPNVIVTIGPTWNIFINLLKQPLHIKKKWIHFNNTKDIQINQIYYCYLKNTIDNKDSNNPLISIFTSTYNSGEKINRPFQSLKNQTYQNWEWIIMDDSTDINFFNKLIELKNNDYRIKIFKSDKNNGNIGQLKYYTASMCKGDLLLELDHDDELTDNCLELIKYHFINYPDIGFFYSDFAELYEKNNNPFNYGEDWGFGYGGYYAQKYKDKIVHVATSVNLNPSTIRYITGVPNHVRVWTSKVYKQLNGHNFFPVVDDYDLLIRTFLNTKCMRIPYLGYLQYRNEDGNTTFIRNNEIQKLTCLIRDYYNPQISDKLKELNIKDNYYSYNGLIWNKPYNYHEQHITFYPIPIKNSVSVIISTYNRPEKLKKAIDSVLNQSYKDYELIIIGDNCKYLDEIMLKYNDNRIRWWNLFKNYNDGGTTPKNYALRKLIRTEYIAYLDDDNYWENNHLESLITKINSDNAEYCFSSFIINNNYKILCKEPLLYRIDTSCLLHKYSLITKYGYWKSIKEIYTHDWELVSRWTNEKYAYTGLYTLNYEADLNKCNPQLIYEYYGDQN